MMAAVTFDFGLPDIVFGANAEVGPLSITVRVEFDQGHAVRSCDVA